MTALDKIETWANSVQNDLIANYQRLGLRASGNWESQLEHKVEETGSGYKITFLGSAYTEQLINGRKPNSNQDEVRAFVGWAGSTFLAEWVRNKGLNINPYAVAYKIAREGITVPNPRNPGTLLSDVFTRERINEVLNDVLGLLVDDIRSDVTNIFRNGNN